MFWKHTMRDRGMLTMQGFPQQPGVCVALDPVAHGCGTEENTATQGRSNLAVGHARLPGRQALSCALQQRSGPGGSSVACASLALAHALGGWSLSVRRISQVGKRAVCIPPWLSAPPSTVLRYVNLRHGCDQPVFSMVCRAGGCRPYGARASTQKFPGAAPVQWR